MITKEKMYGNIKTVAVMEFGNGTIHVVSATGKNDKGETHVDVLFRTGEYVPIGDFTKDDIKGKESDVWPTEIAMIFYKKSSIDVVIEYLLKAKESLKDGNEI